MGDSWGRGVPCSLCCHWPVREREREVGKREVERGNRVVAHMWGKKHSSAHTSLVCSRDYRSAFVSDGGKAGMNR